MSDADNHHHGKSEIIIKRHSGGDHDGAHGGAWKIAYADFMTAMMAFFLVMWLVNAANEETKASVASYFNPIKLSDEKPTQKGVKKPVDQAEGEQQKDRSKVKDENDAAGKAAATGEDMTSSSGDKPLYSESDLFENPYSVLAEIAQEVGQQANVSAKGEGGASDSGPSTGAAGGEAYRDPFDPDFWSQQVQTAPATRAQPGQPANASVANPFDQPPPDRAKDAVQLAVAVPTPRPDPAAAAAAAKGEQAKGEQAQGEQAAGEKAKGDEAKGEEAKGEQSSGEQAQQATALKQQIEQAIAGVAGQLAEGLQVQPAEGGLLVTLSDQQQDPMFNIGSAVPRREMVLAMERIGQILSTRPGAVLIRGHTDARPYKDGGGDNWALSMDRAHAAYFMLVRGGLGEARVKQVSGFADRRLLKPEDPLAPANRRIEILVQGDQG